MKLGDLAGIFEKPVEEFAKTYEIGTDVENLDLETISKILPNEISALKKGLLKKGKDDGYGMAERIVKTDFEKRLKSEFGIDGENLDDLFTGLKSKISTNKPKDDNKLQIEFERIKEQKTNLEKEFDTFKKNIESEKRFNDSYSVFDKHFSEKFDVKSDKLKRLAFEDFAKSFEIEQGNDSIFAIDKKTNKGVSDNFDDLIVNLFKDDFNLKGKTDNPFPKIPTNDPAGFDAIGNSQEELLSQLRLEKDPIRVQQLQAKLKALSK